MERVETTFWTDFSIADTFGTTAILDTWMRAFREWKDNARYLTELSMTLNHKIWQWYEAGNQDYARLYDELWTQVDGYAWEHLKGEDLDFYYAVTD